MLEVFSDFIFQMCYIPSFFCCIKNWCQSELTVRTLLPTKGDMDIEIASDRITNYLYIFNKKNALMGAYFLSATVSIS
jgi:hypothetical protein